MKFLLVRNEKSISDIADNAYKNLSSEAKQQAELELLKANPELKTFKSVRKGFVVHIPELNDAPDKNTHNIVGPRDHLADELSKGLKLFDSSLNSKYTDFEAWEKDTSAKLKVADKELKTLSGGEAVAKQLKKHLADSKKYNETNKKLGLEALKKLQQTVADFDR